MFGLRNNNYEEGKKAKEEGKYTVCLISQFVDIAAEINKTLDYSSDPIKNYKESVLETFRKYCSVVTGFNEVHDSFKGYPDFFMMRG